MKVSWLRDFCRSCRRDKNSASNMLFLAVAVFYELLYLVLQFIVTTLESWYLTLFPKKMKSLAGEIILVSNGVYRVCTV